MRHTLSYAWYRLRATFGSELSYFVSVVLLVGALGGSRWAPLPPPAAPSPR